MNKTINFSAIFTLILASIALTASEPSPGALNVCNKTLTIKKDKTVETPVKYEIKYQGMCGLLPCTKTRTEVKIDSQLVTLWKDVQISTCCPGYTETPDRKCAPVCLKSCNNGQCSAPNVCRCTPEPTETSPGFVGSFCNRFVCLKPNKWGSRCDLECNCPQNSYCSASTGKCLCMTGFRGADCSEECNSTMDCENVELPPIIEPEANVIYDSMIQSQRLEAPRALERDLEDESSQVSKSIANLVAAHMGINLFLILVTSVLVFAVFWYKKRLNQMKRELYYGTYTAPASSNGSDYSSSSNYSSPNNRSAISGRPRMPTPLESGKLSDNLSFAAATRSILKGSALGAGKTNDTRDTVLLAPRIESHLISSKQDSQQNIYSDIESNLSERSYSLKGDTVLPNNTTMLSVRINPTLKEEDGEDHTYKVPKSPTILHEDTSELDQSNLYEEIKPRSSEK